jgi:uncharacterized protein YllA (UPF0747 family)
VVLATEKRLKKAANLGLTWADLFLNQDDLINLKTKEYSQFTIDFSEQKDALKKQFEKLESIAHQTNTSFLGAVKAQETKQIKGLENLEKRLLKAEKRVHSDVLERITLLQNELFPNQSLQERQVNFSEFYEAFGADLISKLGYELDPLRTDFTIIKL